MKLISQRYEQIKEAIAEFLEDYDVKKIPVDVFELARKMHIKIVFASEILERHPKKSMNIYYSHSLILICIMILKHRNSLFLLMMSEPDEKGKDFLWLMN